MTHLHEVHEPLLHHVPHTRGAVARAQLWAPHNVWRHQLQLDLQQGASLRLANLLRVHLSTAAGMQVQLVNDVRRLMSICRMQHIYDCMRMHVNSHIDASWLP